MKYRPIRFFIVMCLICSLALVQITEAVDIGSTKTLKSKSSSRTKKIGVRSRSTKKKKNSTSKPNKKTAKKGSDINGTNKKAADPDYYFNQAKARGWFEWTGKKDIKPDDIVKRRDFILTVAQLYGDVLAMNKGFDIRNTEKLLRLSIGFMEDNTSAVGWNILVDCDNPMEELEAAAVLFSLSCVLKENEQTDLKRPEVIFEDLYPDNGDSAYYRAIAKSFYPKGIVEANYRNGKYYADMRHFMSFRDFSKLLVNFEKHYPKGAIDTFSDDYDKKLTKRGGFFNWTGDGSYYLSWKRPEKPDKAFISSDGVHEVANIARKLGYEVISEYRASSGAMSLVHLRPIHKYKKYNVIHIAFATSSWEIGAFWKKDNARGPDDYIRDNLKVRAYSPEELEDILKWYARYY